MPDGEARRRSRPCARTRSRATSSTSRCGWPRSTARRPPGRSRCSRRRPARPKTMSLGGADRGRGACHRQPARAAGAPARAGRRRSGRAAAAREARPGDDHATRVARRAPRTNPAPDRVVEPTPAQAAALAAIEAAPGEATCCTASPARARPRSTCAPPRRRWSAARA